MAQEVIEISDADVEVLPDAPVEIPAGDVEVVDEAPLPSTEPAQVPGPWIAAPIAPAPDEAPPPMLARDDAEERAHRLRGFLDVAASSDLPSLAAQAELARKARLPVGVVAQHFDEVRKRYVASNRDPVAFARDNPDLADLLDSRADLGPIVVQDEKLHAITQAMRGAMAFVGPVVEERAQAGIENATIVGGFRTLASLVDRFRDPGMALEVGRGAAPKQIAVVEDDRARTVREGGRLGRALARYEDTRKNSDANHAALAVIVAEGERRATGGPSDAVIKAEARLALLEADTAQRNYSIDSVDALLADTAEAVGSMVDMVQGAGVGGVAGAVAGAAITRTPQGAMRGATLGAKVGGGAASGVQEMLGAFREFRGETLPDGRPLDFDTVVGMAALYGAAAGVIESFSFGATERALGPMAKLTAGGLSRKAFVEAVRDEGFLRLATQAGRQYLDGAAKDGAEGALQSLTQDLALLGAKTYDYGAPLPDGTMSLRESLERSGDAFVKEGVGAAGMAGGMAVATAAGNLALAEAARRGAAKAAAADSKARTAVVSAGVIDRLYEVAATPTATADPAAAAEAVARVSAGVGMPVRAVYIDPADLRTAMEGATDPDAAAAALVGMERLKDAMATGARVEIPVAEFLEKIATRPDAASLREFLTVAPDVATPRRLKLMQAPLASDQEVKRLTDEYLASTVKAESEGEAAFLAGLEAQVTATGVLTADQARRVVALNRAIVRVMADRFDLPADEIFAHYSLTVQAGAPGPASTAAADAAAAPEEAPTPAPTPGQPPAVATAAPQVAPETTIDAGVAPPPPAVAPVAPAGEQAPSEGLAPGTAEAAMVAAAPSEAARRTLITPQKPAGEPVTYKVVELDDLLPSHDPDTFAPAEGYPEGVQERTYHSDKGEQLKVIQGAANLNPALLLNNAPTPADGPPMVAAGEGPAIVLGGNGRAMMLKRALRTEAVAAAYRQGLLEVAGAFGVDPDRVAGMRSPVLVRVLDDVRADGPKEALVAAVRRTNEAMTQGLSPAVAAVAEARQLPADAMARVAGVLADTPDASLRDVMRERPDALIAVLRSVGVITARNEATWLQKGVLTEAAKDKIDAMLLARVLETPERVMGAPGVARDAIQRSLPSILRVAGINPGFDVSPKVRAAVDLMMEARARGMTVAEMTQTVDMFNPRRPDPEAVALAALFGTGKPRAVADRFAAFAKLAAFDPRQRTFFAPNPTLAEAMRPLLEDLAIVPTKDPGVVAAEFQRAPEPEPASRVAPLPAPGPDTVPVPAPPRTETPHYKALLERARGIFALPEAERDAALGKEYGIDSLTGAWNRYALESVPLPAGQTYVVLTTVDAKPINDNPFNGGHEATNDLLRVMTLAVAKADGVSTVARGGTNLIAVVPEATAELVADGMVRRVREAVGIDALALDYGIGRTLAEASRAMDDRIADLREKGERAPRGKASKGLDTDTARLPRGKGKLRRAAPPELVAQVRDLTPEQFVDLVYYTPHGLLTAEGWHAAEAQQPSTFVVAGDLMGLRNANETHGKAVGDQILEAFAEAAHRAGANALRVAHLSGDEYAFGTNDAALRDRFLAALQAETSKMFVEAKTRLVYAPGATAPTVVPLDTPVAIPVRSRYGLGKNYGHADADLNLRRLTEAAAVLQSKKVEDRTEEDQNGIERGKRAEDDLALRSLSVSGAPVSYRGGARGSAGAEPLGGLGAAGQGSAASAAGRAGEGGEAGARGRRRRLKQDERGSMERDGGSFRITINAGADVSTFLHESAHVWLELLGDLAERQDAPASVRAMWADALKFLGARDRAGIGTKEHERWARSFEAYLLRGKEPASNLTRAFAAFRRWLTGIYGSVQALGSDVSPDLAAVFDRLLVTDEEAAGYVATARPLPFRSPDEAGMTPEQWKEYLDKQVKATSAATRYAELATLRDRLAAVQNEIKDATRALVPEVEAEYRNLPALQAQMALRGRAFAGNGKVIRTGKPLKLDRGSVAAVLGPERLNLVPTSSVGGIAPDTAARQFGFADGAEMLRAIAGIPEQAAFVKRRLQERLAEVRGGLLTERAAIREDLNKGFHGDATAEWLLEELRILRRKAKQGPPPLDSIREAAKVLLGKRQVQSIAPYQFLRQERQAGDRAFRAAVRGNFAQAAAFKQQQLLNFYLWREADAAAGKIERAEDYLSARRSAEFRGNLRLAGEDFLTLHDAILTATGWHESPFDVTAALDALSRVEASTQELDFGVAFDVSVIRRLIVQQQRWEDLTVYDALEVRDAIANLRAIANAINTVRIADQKRATSDVILSISLETEVLPDLGDGSVSEAGRTARPVLTRAWEWFQGLHGELVNPETMLRGLGETSYEFFWRRYQDAKAKKRAMTREVLDPFLQELGALEKEWGPERFDEIEGLDELLPYPPDIGIGGPRDRVWLFMVLLNMGNAGNKQRMLDGYGWTEAYVMAALYKHMPESGFKFAQKIWDLFDQQLYPEIAAKYARSTGVVPGKVEATPLQTRFGTFRGGYFPARYDKRVSRQGEAQDEQASSLAALFGPNNRRPYVPKDHSKARAESFSDFIRLDWNVLPRHIQQVLHDVSFDEFVRDAARVATRKDFQNVLRKRWGEKRSGNVLEWLKYVANAEALHVGDMSTAWNRALAALRSRAVTGSLGWSLAIAAGDVANPLAAMALGPKEGGTSFRWAMEGFLRAFPLSPSYPRTRRLVLEKSQEARNRASQHDDEARMRFLQRFGRKVSLPERWRDAVLNTAFWMQQQTDKVNTTQIWWARYHHEIARGVEEAQAVRLADEAVTSTLVPLDRAEAPAIIRTPGGIGALIAYFGFFAQTYSMATRLAGRGQRAVTAAVRRGRRKDAADAMLEVSKVAGRVLGMVLVTDVLGEILSGRGPEEDEDRETWLAAKVAGAPLMRLPAFGGYLAAQVEGAVRDQPVSTNPRAAPALALTEHMVKRLHKILSDNSTDEEAAWAAVEAALYAAKLPVSQPTKTAKAFAEVTLDDWESMTFWETLSRLYRGPPPANRDRGMDVFQIIDAQDGR